MSTQFQLIDAKNLGISIGYDKGFEDGLQNCQQDLDIMYNDFTHKIANNELLIADLRDQLKKAHEKIYQQDLVEKR